MRNKRWAALAKLMGIGWYIGLSMVLPALGGRWLDRQLNTNVFFTFLGLGVGVIIAFAGVYYYLYPMARRGDNNARVSH